MESDIELVNRHEREFTNSTAREFLAEIERVFAAKSFEPHAVLRNGHVQTLVGYAWPRRSRLRSAAAADQQRLFEVAPDAKVLAHCRWQVSPALHPTVVIWHGIEGSTESVYMLGTAQKAFRVGFNVVRVNVRNCGGTDHLTPKLYHGGLSEDLRAVTSELIERDHLPRLYVIGFSLGGNMALKFAAEYSDGPPPELRAICAVSPAADLAASLDVLSQRSNWLYHRNILSSLCRRIKNKKRLYLDLYDLSELGSVRTIRDFDDRYTSVMHGFANADDYYEKASSHRLLDRIRVPTLIIHAVDDPFIPFAPLRHPSVLANPHLLLVASERGGHVAFVGKARPDEDRFWAENRVVEFCLLTEAPAGE